ncbi:NADPH:quinone reductase-like Zn-dependent oxidoreductase [Mumia flava]|uniref:NADPH:quinone reductase-like Zn-dependent oxidoreductase n=1 Tax=Mumia flava TaxID=1348852 RepID=A0A0B2B3G1_9ACTN|nr:NAD(P)-dependent alcohol dehydrogenase [Mumia flava]PJJ53383.1 NADPH:quinone reductase-like Zn-dependent oxidoreductase [Mumia flava]
MRAVAYDRYGPPGTLRLVDLPTPEPGPGQVLVRVAATSINLSDWENLTGSPAYARIGGLRRPRRRVLGSDLAGQVAEVGEGVAGFAVGDEVYGDNLFLKGGFGEYAVAPAAVLARRPDELSPAEAATIPQSGAIALQGTARAAAGRRVLINGAGGGSGVFAVQLARRAGAHVTGVDNASKLDFMTALGCDEVIDYRRADFSRGREPYDLVLDMVTGRSVFAYRRALAPGGRYLCTGGPARALLRVATVGAAAGLLSGRHLGVLMVREGPEHFEPMARLCSSGEVAIHIDRVVGLEEVPDALARVGAGLARGKVVVVPG